MTSEIGVMIEATTIFDKKIRLAEDCISVVAGPNLSEERPACAYIRPRGRPIITREAPQLLIARLAKPAAFAVFHRPNGTPLWIRAPSLSMIRAPLSTETGVGLGTVWAVVLGAGFHQSVQEDINTAEQIIAAHSQ
jgi:hypothetical protein